MEKFETMKHYLRNKCIEIDEKTFEDVKDYVNYSMEKKNGYTYDLTDNGYLEYYIQEMVECALLDDRYEDLKDWAIILYELYRNEF